MVLLSELGKLIVGTLSPIEETLSVHHPVGVVHSVVFIRKLLRLTFESDWNEYN